MATAKSCALELQDSSEECVFEGSGDDALMGIFLDDPAVRLFCSAILLALPFLARLLTSRAPCVMRARQWARQALAAVAVARGGSGDATMGPCQSTMQTEPH